MPADAACFDGWNKQVTGKGSQGAEALCKCKGTLQSWDAEGRAQDPS